MITLSVKFVETTFCLFNAAGINNLNVWGRLALSIPAKYVSQRKQVE